MRLIVDQPDRLDRFLARMIPEASRTRLAKLIEAGEVFVDGEIEKPSFKLEPGMEVDVDPPGDQPPHDLTPYAMDLDVVFEDADIIVINKPRGLASHPAASLHEPSLVNALLAHGSQLSTGSQLFRPGIVHRLDKETTGLIVVAKNDAAHASLAEQIATKSARRSYFAVVSSPPSSEVFDVDAPIARDPRNRIRMAVVSHGRDALTHVQMLRRTPVGSLLGVRLSTGRTHQIRVHLSAVGHPVVGDTLYGGGDGPLQLHAAHLAITHPASGAPMKFTAPAPPEFVIEPLAEDYERLQG